MRRSLCLFVLVMTMMTAMMDDQADSQYQVGNAEIWNLPFASFFRWLTGFLSQGNHNQGFGWEIYHITVSTLAGYQGTKRN